MNKLIRKCKISIEEVERILKPILLYDNYTNLKISTSPNGKRKVRVVEIAGEEIYAFSDRYRNLFVNGYTCKHCGIIGSFFALEKSKNDNRYHLNMYALDNEGNEVMMTKDHIIPKSLGGENSIKNYQTLCEKCNVAKGNNMID